jgi:hypothetical protein
MKISVRKTCALLILSMSLFFAISCEKSTIVHPKASTIDTTKKVSFGTEVVPIFTNNENCSSCHSPGSDVFSLASKEDAWNSIQVNNLVNISAPESSKLYYKIIESNPLVHDWKKYTPSEAQTVLTWITQGAKNN